MNHKINIYNEKKATIQSDMTGLFFEDINYSADGGLYAELLENRHFEFYKAFQGDVKGDFFAEYDGLYGWAPVGKGELKIVSGSPVAEENPHYLRFKSTAKGDGFSNKAYDGVTLKSGMEYKLSFYARNISRIESVTVKCCDRMQNVAASSEIKLNIHQEDTLCPWVKYEAVLKAGCDVRGASFIVTVAGSGLIEFDFFSLIPADAVCGIFRKDLFDKLNEIHPGFIRFPGGCIIEGSTLSNRYDFKKTLKPVEHRQNNWSRWAVHKTWQNHKDEDGPVCYPHYNQTYGIGYYEFFLLCEKLGCKPLPVLNVGLSCQFQNFEMVDPDSEEFAQYVQDAVDLIEFANGPVDSKWGKVRASLGHPAPFNMEMVGIGNEQWETKDNRFFDRYCAFEKAIHDKYPEMKLIGSAGPNVEWPEFTKAWDFIRGKTKSNPSFAYAIDEHYYMPPAWFVSHNDFYDNYDRSVKVFAGEYAAHPEGGGSFNRPYLNTLEGAVSEAAFMTGVERNADVVVLASYAPLFARMGYSQWSPDMIWFDDEKSYGTPSYWVQMMYSNFTGDFTLDTKNEHKELQKDGIFYNASLDSKTGKVFVKIANTNDCNAEIELSLNGFDFSKQKTVYIGGLEKTAVNSFAEPEKIRLEEGKEEKFNGKVVLPKNSFSVVVLSSD